MRGALSAAWSPRSLIVVACLAGLAVFVLQEQHRVSKALTGGSEEDATGFPASNSSGGGQRGSSSSTNSTWDIVGVREVVLGTEVLLVRTPSPKGVLLVFHGCSHSAIDFWYKSAACATCLGLPEEVAVTKQTVARGFALVAFSSEDREVTRCWDTVSPDAPERQRILKVWQSVSTKEGWAGLPVYGLGGSSGGAMVMHMAFRLPFQGIGVQIMAMSPSQLEEKPTNPDTKETWQYPPTYFMHMPRDTRTAEYVAKDIAVLQKLGVRAAEHPVWPRPLYPHYFSDRVDGIAPNVSEALVNALTGAGMLNATGFLLENPRQTEAKWQQVIRHDVPEAADIPLEADVSPVFEELNVAWAKHELASDAIGPMFDFFKAGPAADHPKLLSKVKP